jgi:hypothetical protein
MEHRNPPTVTVTPDPHVPGRVFISGARLSFAAGLNAARAGKPDPVTGNTPLPRYDCVLLVPEAAGEALQALWNAMRTAAVSRWRDRADVVMTELNAGARLAVRSGAAKASTPGFLGSYSIACGAKVENPPVLLDNYLNAAGTGPQELKRPQARLYSGCYVNAQLDFWPQDNQAGGKRVNADIKVVQFLTDGDPLGGGGAPADASAFASFASAPNPALTPGFGAPPQGAGFGAPPQGAGFGAPPQGAGFGAPPQGAGFGAPPQGAGFGAPPQGAGFGAPPQGAGFGAPPQGAGFGAPPQGAAPSFGAPPQGAGFGAPPQGAGFGAPPQGAAPSFGAPPQGAAPSFGAPPQGAGFGAPPF